jgi:ATP-dependent protease HslVU (ClpYQ) peptidase subunit
MTTIIGIEVEEGAVIAADGRISTYDNTGYSTQISTLHDSTKLHITPHYTIGTAGDLRAINIIAHALEAPTPPKNASPNRLYKYLITEFVPQLQETFDEYRYSTTPKNSETSQSAEHSSTLIIAIQGKVFYIEGDYSVMRDTNGLYAIGTGASYALGHLHTRINPTTSLKQTQQHTLDALHVAAHYDPYTGPPYTCHTVPTKKQEKNGRT